MSTRTRITFARATIVFTAGDRLERTFESFAALGVDEGIELAGVFIEDADMLRAARLPFALEFCRSTNVVRTVDADVVEKDLRGHAERARKLLAYFAEQRGSRWRFDVLRERTAHALLELAKGTDITMFASPDPVARSDTAGHSLRARTVVAVVDRSAAGRRALEIARGLAQKRGIDLGVILVAATAAGIRSVRERVENVVTVPGARLRELSGGSLRDVFTEARGMGAGAIVLPVAQLESARESFVDLAAELHVPLFIVR